MSDLIPLSEVERDLDAPGGGWRASLAARGVPVVEDDLGRPSISRSDARLLFVERREAEVRARELRERQDAEAEARRQASARPGWTLPPGMSVAEAIAAAEYAEKGYSGPRRRTLVEDALAPDGGLVFHPIRSDGSEGDG